MAKTYLNTVKYEVRAKYEITGIVEKPDIIGAIFGQSEGLLGADMDLKELQQNGKLGRIEITVNKDQGKTFGEIIIPSSLDQVKTSILAATIETVEKVGPCEAKVTILTISDTRKEKRDIITDRAKALLQKMQKFEGVESEAWADSIKSTIRTEKAVNYAGLTAGPEVETSNDIIVVEGRADVLKLLSYGIKSAIEMNGSNISKELIDLCKTKNVTVLVDGDRGGELNVRKLASLTNVNFLARAPDGKEVEELTQKEILQALKRREAFDAKASTHKTFERRNNSNFVANRPNTFQNNNRSFERNDRPAYSSPRPAYAENRPSYGNQNNFRNDRPNFRNDRPAYGEGRPAYGNQNNFRNDRPAYGDRNNFRNDRPQEARGFDPFEGNYRKSPNTNTSAPVKEVSKEVVAKPTTPKVDASATVKSFEKDFSKIKGSLKARLYDKKNKKIKDVAVKDLVQVLDKNKKPVETIVFDGIVTKRLIDVAEKNNIKTIVGVKKGKITSNKVNTLTM